MISPRLQSKKLLFVAVFFVLFTLTSTLACNLAIAGVLYVDGEFGVNPSDCTGGTQWSEAFETIQKAIDCAADADEIWVKEGVYYLDSEITVNKPVYLYGGFTGSEVDRDQRNWRQNVTTVDGQNRVNHCFRITADATVDGFTITGGNARGLEPSGGGILNEFSSPIIANCTITKNSAAGSGGGISNTGSATVITTPIIVNSWISENDAVQTGGGIDNFYSSPTIANTTIWKNTVGESGFGGGIRNFASSPSITNCTITENHSDFYGGGVLNNLSDSTITNSIIYGNTAAVAGDEILDIVSNPTITYSNVRGGYEGTGNIDGDPLFANATIGNLHLLANSPSIDAGNDSAVPADTADLDGDGDTDEPIPLDLDGEPRFDKNVDMGAYEYVHQPDITITDSVVLTGDLWIPFGALQVGNSKEETVKISNTGTADLIIGDIAITDPVDSPFGLDASNCSDVTLSPGDSCICTVIFSPTEEGRLTDTFDIPSNDPNEASVTVSVSGIGTPEPQPNITVTDSVAPSGDLRVLFGNVPVGDSKGETVAIANTGELILTIGDINLADPISEQFSLDASNCSGVDLDPGQSCTLIVTFAPTDLGTFTNDVVIPSNDPDDASVQVEVTGTAAQYTLIVGVDPAGSGTVRLSPPGGRYDPGTAVTMTAIANSGWAFSGWSGDLSGSENPVNVTINNDQSVTANFLMDTDLDGISDEEEDAGLNGGDGNNDGQLDSTQKNVVNLKTYDGQYYITLESPSGTTMANCKASGNPDPDGAPSGVKFPYGFFDFVISGLNPGSGVKMTLYLHADDEFNTYYKYGPTPGQPVSDWYKFIFNGITGAWIRGNVIDLYFRDAQRGDDDRLANGVIVDQGGPGSASSNGSSGSKRGCFIATAAFGSPLERHVTVLRKFRDRFLFTNAPGRTFVDFYQTYSPLVADFIAKHPALRTLVRLSLLPVVGISWLFVHLGPFVAMVSLYFTLIGCVTVFFFIRIRLQTGHSTGTHSS